MACYAAPEFRGSDFLNFLHGIVTAALALALCGPITACAESSNASELTSWQSTRQPDFVLEDLDRRIVALGEQQGRVVVVHFFATWCEPCREELPALRRLAERSDSTHVKVLAISVAEPDARVRGFIEKAPVNFPVLLDRDRKVAKSWNVHALPTTFILDRTLTPRLFIERDYDWDRLDISSLLASITAQSAGTGLVSSTNPKEEKPK